MTKKSPTIVFFGNERLATGVTTSCDTLKALIKEGYHVAAVVLHNESATSRKKRQVEIAELAEQHNIPVLMPSKLSDIADDLKAFDAEIGVLVAFGKIIPQATIDIFPRGIINIHPSNLPKHRGPTPIESVMLQNEPEITVSLMDLVREMDAGPVYASRTIPVPTKVEKQALVNQVAEIGSKMIVQNLPAILNGSLKAKPQDHSAATYDSLIQKSDGVVDWNQPAETIERQIRAYAGWPKSSATLAGHQFIITQANVINTSGKTGSYQTTKKELIVFCGKDALSITRVQPVNKKEMPIQAFLAGYSL